MTTLEPLPYHRRVLDYLKSEESDLFHWFASTEAQAQYAERIRMDLLKATYRMERDAHATLYATADAVAATLGVKASLTLYQSPGAGELNASLFYLPQEAHLVLTGPLLEVLTVNEQAALLAHELSHYRFYDDPEYLVADQLLSAVAGHPDAGPSHAATARLWDLYQEIHADRGALGAVGEVAPVVSMLVKVLTGLRQVSAESYLRQAEEIFRQGPTTSDGHTHPEPFIRARALTCDDTEIARMIEGAPTLDHLDLLGQQRLTELTRRMLGSLLAPTWFRSEVVQAHAKLFADTLPDEGIGDLSALESSARDYLCYVMLDFCAVDPDLEDQPLRAAAALARRSGIGERFLELAAKELKLPKRTLKGL